MIHLTAKIHIIGGIIIEQHTITITISLNRCTTTPAFFKPVVPSVRNKVNHRLLLWQTIIGLIHIIYIKRFFPRSNQPLVIERPYLVNTAQSLVRLTTPRIVMATVNPLKLPANRILHTLCLTYLSFHKQTHAFLTPNAFSVKSCRLGVQINTAPRAIFTV